MPRSLWRIAGDVLTGQAERTTEERRSLSFDARPQPPIAPLSKTGCACRIQRAYRLHKLMHELRDGDDAQKLVRLSTTSMRSTSRTPFDGTVPDTRLAASDAAYDLMERSEIRGRRISSALGLALPQIEVARLHTAARLPRQGPHDERPGQLWPLTAHLRIFDTFGSDVSQYFFFLHRALRVFVTIFLINLSNIVIAWEGQQLHHAGNIFTWHTLGNLGPNGVLARGGHSFVVVELVTSYLLVSFLFHMRYKLAEIRKRVRRAEGRQLRAVDFTVLVSGVPPRWGSREVRAHFERHGEVAHVGLALDNRALILALRAESAAQDAREDACLHLAHAMQRRPALTPKQLSKARAAARAAAEAEAAARCRVARLVRRRYDGSGYAFVTFNSFDDAQRLRLARWAAECAPAAGSAAGGGVAGGTAGGGAAGSTAGGGVLPRGTMRGTLRSTLRESIRGSFMSEAGGPRLRVEEAPAAAAVMWENLGTSRTERLVRTALTNGLLLVLAVLGTSILMGTNIFNSGWTQWLDVKSRSPFASFGLWLGSTLLIVAGHLVFIVATPLLVLAIERPRSHDELERSIMVKLSFFQWLNNMLTAVTLLFVPTQYNPHPSWKFDSSWYPTGASLIFNAMLGDLTVICWGIDFLRPADLWRRRWAAPRAKTQARANELHAVEAEITLAFRVQLMNKFLLLGLTFAFAMPVLYLFVALYMWSAQWVDRVNFLRRLVPPPPTNGGQMRIVVDWVLPLAILLHVVMAVWLFFDICDQNPLDYALGLLGGGDDNPSRIAGGDTVGTCARLIDFALANASEVGSGATGPPGVCTGTVDTVEALLQRAPNASLLQLECYVADDAAACELKGGVEATCSSSSSAKWLLLLSSAFWLLWVGLYFYVGQGRRATSQQATRSLFRLGTLLRFLTQRDMIASGRAADPADARAGATIRARELREPSSAGAPRSALSSPARGPGSSSGTSPSSARSPHLGRTASRDGPPALLESTLFYLPPLTRLLLLGNLREAANRRGTAGAAPLSGPDAQARLDEMERSSVLFGMDL